jgi:bis(5'-nucleosidyl)-tetraphosphatase
MRILSAGVVIVRCGARLPYYLLLRAYSHWDFPKGVVEQGEDPFAAACREVKEETSLDTLTFPWGVQYRETGVYGPGKVARYYLGRCDSGDVVLPVSAELNRPEHDEYRWVPYQEAQPLLGERVARIMTWAHTVVGPQGRTREWEKVTP